VGEEFWVKTRIDQGLFSDGGFARLVVVLEELSVLLELKVYLFKKGIFCLLLFLIVVARSAMCIAKEFIDPSFDFLFTRQTDMWLRNDQKAWNQITRLIIRIIIRITQFYG
jgi:hypothetical protein